MGRHYISPEPLCPFYHAEDFAKIYCEGVGGNTSIHLAFKSVTELREFRAMFCDKGYKDCHIAKMHYKRYEEDK